MWKIGLFVVCWIASAAFARAQFPGSKPPDNQAPVARSFLGVSLPEINLSSVTDIGIEIPSIEIPPIDIPIEIGHKTNKWDVRHNLENGWMVAYGREIGYAEYAELASQIALSVTTENPEPVLAYLNYLLAESVRILRESAQETFSRELLNLAKQELVKALNDAIKHGRLRTIRLESIEIQIGIATYNRSETGVPLPNTFQPYIRMRVIIGSEGTQGNKPVFNWVVTLHNPNSAELHYSIGIGDSRRSYVITANNWRWHSFKSTTAPNIKIQFDAGPPRHKSLTYSLNSHRIPTGKQITPAIGEQYTFSTSKKGDAWDLYKGSAKYRWVVNIHNPNTSQLNYALDIGSGYVNHTVNAGASRWHWVDSAFEPDVRIRFDSDPSSAAHFSNYDLSTIRMPANTDVTEHMGMHYFFWLANNSWHLYTGRGP